MARFSVQLARTVDLVPDVHTKDAGGCREGPKGKGKAKPRKEPTELRPTEGGKTAKIQQHRSHPEPDPRAQGGQAAKGQQAAKGAAAPLSGIVNLVDRLRGPHGSGFDSRRK